MEPISKSEGKVIKRRLNNLLSNFDDKSRHQLSETLIRLAKFIHPHKNGGNEVDNESTLNHAELKRIAKETAAKKVDSMYPKRCEEWDGEYQRRWWREYNKMIGVDL